LGEKSNSDLTGNGKIMADFLMKTRWTDYAIATPELREKMEDAFLSQKYGCLQTEMYPV
jgi:hypothetical protein